MKRRMFLLGGAAGAVLPARGAGWEPARRGHAWDFPSDHYRHDDYRTEWWYVTGVLEDGDGGQHGFQFTIFRRGVRPPGAREPVRSRLVVDHFALGHFTHTDVAARRFRHGQELSRGAFGEAGFGEPGSGRLAWIGANSLTLESDGSFRLTSQPEPGCRLELRLEPSGPPVRHGENGWSRKGASEANASLYYSLTRMGAVGTLTSDGRERAVRGRAWLDREWASNQLGPGQVGWDWFSLSLSDGRDLMLYRMRLADGTADPFSSGTLIEPGGRVRSLKSTDFRMTPGTTWRSAATGGAYPVTWRLEVPGERLDLEVRAVLEAQELALQPVSYWEGFVAATGKGAAVGVTGEGYLEMTGYAAPLQVLRGE